MKSKDFQIPHTHEAPPRVLLVENVKEPRAYSPETESSAPPLVVSKAGLPMGWMERTLLAVDTDRVFIDASDPGLRGLLVATFEAEGRDVIAAADGETLLRVMERLPVPDDLSGDILLVQDDLPGRNAIDLLRRIRARGWSLPALIVSSREPLRFFLKEAGTS